MLSRRAFLAASGSFAAISARAETADWANRLVGAAEAQIGVTIAYDPAYVKLAYPEGDVPRDRGVCTDVVIRAYRDGLGIDLQRLVHEDMRAAFASYPKLWGLKRPDANIDHRRVPNLQTYFRRRNAALTATADPSAYLAGDLVTMLLPGNLPHITMVSGEFAEGGARPLLVHNIGAGTRRADVLFAYPITGHYRFNPA